MAHFSLTHATWPDGFVPGHTSFEDLDLKTSKAINGDNGGLWGPDAIIEIRGEGLSARHVYGFIVMGANADTTYAVATTRLIYLDASITADRTYTLSATGAVDGDVMEIVALPTMSPPRTVSVRDNVGTELARIVGEPATRLANAHYAKFVYVGTQWRLLSSRQTDTQPYADFAALRAVPAPAMGDRAFIPFRGEFVFQRGVIRADDPPLFIAPADGSLGTWVNSAFFGMTDGPNCVPRMVGYKVEPSNLPQFLVAIDARGPISFSGTAGAAVDIPGTSMSFDVLSGDILIVDAQGLLGTPSAGAVALTVYASINGAASIGEASAIAGVHNGLQFKRIMTNGTLVVKLILTSTSGVATGVNVTNASVSVMQVRP
jgi:hypothetical protein